MFGPCARSHDIVIGRLEPPTLGYVGFHGGVAAENRPARVGRLRDDPGCRVFPSGGWIGGRAMSALNRWAALALMLLWTAGPHGGVATLAAAQTPPPLMLANVYRGQVALDDYWVSEKLDGVRGYWDGKALLTRGGERIAAPAWFTAGWPNTPLDGELWAGRGQFSRTVSIVRQQSPSDADWATIRFMVFDLPASAAPFAERLAELARLVQGIGKTWVQVVPQTRVRSRGELMTMLERVVRDGGEGLMLHRGASLYRAERSDDLLKVKPFEDAEARVVGHVPGQGKFAGLLGALLVEMPDGKRFRIGSGFSTAQRRDPPPIGSWVSYRHSGFNEGSGLPRFARFLRIREDMPDLQLAPAR